MNKIILSGRLTKDPEMKIAGANGTSVTRFTLAVARPFKKDETDFINCVAFGKTAETINQYFKKGSGIDLSGHIQTGSYDAQDGTKRYTTDVVVESFEFPLGNKGASNEDAPKENAAATSNTTEDLSDIVPVDDGDMPF